MTLFPSQFGYIDLHFVAAVLEDDDQIDGVDLAGSLPHSAPVERECHVVLCFGNPVYRRKNDTCVIAGLAEFEVVLLEVDALVVVLVVDKLVTEFFDSVECRHSIDSYGGERRSVCAEVVCFNAPACAACCGIRFEPFEVLHEIDDLVQTVVLDIGGHDALYRLGQPGVVAGDGYDMAGQGGKAQACRCVHDADRILGVLRNGEAAAVEDALDGDVSPFGGGVIVDFRTDVLRFGVVDRSAGQNRHLVAVDYRSEFLRIGRLGSQQRNLVADGNRRTVRDEDIVCIFVVADDEAFGRHGHDDRRRYGNDRFVRQGGEFTCRVLLHIAVFVSVLHDEHLGAACKSPSLEDEGRFAGIVLRTVAHVVGHRNRHVHDAGSRVGRDRHPVGDFRHPVGVGIDGDDLFRRSFRFEIQGVGARQNSFGKVVLILVAAPEGTQGRHEDRGCHIFYKSHNLVF